MTTPSPLPFRGQLELMGIPVRIEADREPLLRAAMHAFEGWSSPGGGAQAGPLVLRLRTGEPVMSTESAVRVRVEGGLLHLSGSGVMGRADIDAREAVCTVPPQLIPDSRRLAAEVLDTLALFLLTRSGRLPLHAAGILLRDTGVLLAGPSGSGKSTLAHTALGAGIPVLSEDTVYLQLQPNLRVWGSPRPIHLLPHDQAEPARSAEAALRLRNGRWKVAVPMTSEGAHSPGAGRAALCLLERGERVALRPLDPEIAADRVLSSLEPGFDHFRRELPYALAAITASGAWTLTLTDDPGEAVSALRGRFGG